MRTVGTMPRWTETVTLLKPANKWQDEEGAWHEGEREEREVFASVQMLGTLALSQLRSSEVRFTSGEKVPHVGPTKMHVIYVKQIDYEDEDQLIYDGREMDVIAGTSEGEDYKLIVRRRIGND